jgi:chromosome segregation ATPase
MEIEQAETSNGISADSSPSGRWIRDQLREVGDSGLVGLERRAAGREVAVEAITADESDEKVFATLTAGISSAVIEPIRNLERSRAAQQQQVQSNVNRLAADLEEMQRRFGTMDRELESTKRVAARSQALMDELKPGLSALEDKVMAFEAAFRRDMEALGSGLEQVRAHVEPLAARVQGSEEALGRHSVALEAVARLERRRQEASRQLLTSVDGLRSSLDRLANLELLTAEPPPPEFPAEEGGQG